MTRRMWAGITVFAVLASICACGCAAADQTVQTQATSYAPKGQRTRHDMNEFEYTELARDGATFVYGTITKSATWKKSSSPYVMAENVFVAEKATLTIEPGVVIRVVHPADADTFRDKGIRLDVEGTLIACGTPDSMICFTSSATEPQKGKEWEGIHICGKTPSVLTWTSVGYARFGVDCYSSCLVAHCVLEHCAAGIYLERDFGGDIVHNVSAYNGTGVTCNATCPDATIMNNIFYMNLGGIEQLNDGNAFADYNLCSGEKGRAIKPDYKGIKPGKHDLSADPKFTNPTAGNFHLAAGSPARGAAYGGDMGLDQENWSKKEVENWLAGGARAVYYAGMAAVRSFGKQEASRLFQRALKMDIDVYLRARIQESLDRLSEPEKE